MAFPNKPQLSVVIVTYDSLIDLKRCLPTVLNQLVPVEILVVDNHGADGIAEWLEESRLPVRYFKNKANTGYAGGNNLGLHHAQGRWTLFLNPDTELSDGCLSRLLATANTYPDAFLNPKLLNPDGTINACGNQMQYTGITTCRGINQPAHRFMTIDVVPLLSGAAMMAPTQVARQLGGFDEGYFMYFEDADLSLRAKLSGHTLLCDASAVITHHYQLRMSPAKFYYLERNRLLTFFKVFSRSTLLQLAPALLVTELITWGYALRGLPYLKSRFATYAWLWNHRKNWQVSRQTIQAVRTCPDSVLLQDSTVALPMEQLVTGWHGRYLERITQFVYRLLRPAKLAGMGPTAVESIPCISGQ